MLFSELKVGSYEIRSWEGSTMKHLILAVVFGMLVSGCVPVPPPAATPASKPADGAAMEKTCTDAGGKYLALFNECENVSSEACTAMGGTFDECASACRHAPEAVMCTAQCVPVCSFGAAGVTKQPEAVMAQLSNGSLECTRLTEPITIDGVVAHYGCRAPGAYLTFVDTRGAPWTAGYFTTDSQSTKVTYGPERVTVLPKQ
jgi:hypothetical protein